MSSHCSRPLTEGEVIIECKPLIHVIKDEYKSKHCDNCLKLSDELKKCSKCRQMFYCDKRCQQKDWKYHKNECKIYSHKKYDPKQSSDNERLCLRLYLRIKSDEKFATKRYQLFDGSEVCLNDIEVNVKDFSKDMERMVEFKILTNHFKDYGLEYDRKELLRWFAFVSTNPSKVLIHYFPEYPPNYKFSEMFADIIRTATYMEVGFGLYIQMSCLTHSCAPNSELVLNGLSLQLRAMKSIPIGEQITISLINLNQNKTERQKQLKSEFCIDCKCEKCELNLDLNIDYSKFNKKFSIKLELFLIEHITNVEDIMAMFESIYGTFSTPQTYYLLMLLIKLVAITLNNDLSDKSIALPVLSFYAQILMAKMLVTHGFNNTSQRHPIYEIYSKVISEINSIKG